MSVVWADAPGTLQEFHRDLKGRVAPPCRCPPAGPLNFKGFQETAAPACRQRANIPLSRYAIRNLRYLRPGTSPRSEISRQILSFVLGGGGNKARGEQTSGKLRVICAGERTNERTWQIRKLGREDERRPLGLIKIFRTLPLLITSP